MHGTGVHADVVDVDVSEASTGRLVHTESGVTLAAKRWMQVDTVLSAQAPGVVRMK